MPTYEYECLECKSKFDKFQTMTEAVLEKCPNCGGKVKRLIGKGAGIIFRGAGFYATDNRKPEKKAVPKKEESPSANSKKEGVDSTTSKKENSSDSKS
ncbi:MAG: zinc ribbon domain-containing protein [Candidatus Saelkia tenebricola]|nr:zinc ribbon domain-containing protein [Candidatus Saelkia tenebricola]